MLRIATIAILAVALMGAGIAIKPSKRYELLDCASGGSASSVSITKGTYAFRVKDGNVYVCHAATCAAGGEWWPQNTVMQYAFTDTTSVSCRSETGSSSDIFFTAGASVP